VDEDRTPGSQAFLDKLSASAEVRVVPTGRSQAVERVRKGKSVAYLILPQGFGERYQRPFVRGFPEIEAGIDPGRKAEQGLLQGVLAKYLFQQFIDMFTNPDQARAMVADAVNEVAKDEGMDPFWRSTLQLFLPALDRFLAAVPKNEAGAGNPQDDFAAFGVEFTSVAREGKRPRKGFDISFPQSIVWALLSCASGFGISLVSERTKGTLIRLRMTPATPRHILAGKSIGCFVTTLGVTIALLAAARVVFGVRPDSLGLLALAVTCSCICFVGIMMFLSVLGRTEQSAAGIGWAILMVMAMIGGGMIPLFAMPGWMQRLSHVSPVKWTIYAMEGAIWRGFSLPEMLLPCGILVSVGAVCFVIGVRTFRWSESG
jgi:ABC-2 type transport system permease protein